MHTLKPWQQTLTALALSLWITGLAADKRSTVRPPVPESRLALVIGNQNYPDKPLKNPVNDARAMQAKLKDLGFRVIYLENASLPQMDEAMAAFGKQLQEGGVGLFYYAGHGMEIDGANYLIPVGVSIHRRAELKERGYQARIALNTMQEAKVLAGVVLLDACRTPPVRGESGGLAEMGDPGAIVAFAAAPKQSAEDGDGDHGTFTKHLLAHLADPGVEALQTLARVQTAVAKETRNTQQPWIGQGSLEAPFCFASCPAEEAGAGPKTPPAEDLASEIERLKQENQALKQAQAAAKTEPVSKPDPGKAHLLPAGPHGIQMVALPGGSFQMGCGPNDGECNYDEKPRHAVTVRPFAIGQTEVTQGQWKAVMGAPPPELHFKQCGDDCPVAPVSWDDAQAFIAKLNRMTGKHYRLPTEAEWEYACRAGRDSLYCGGDGVDAVAWHGGNAGRKTHPVKGKQANGFGLYDMSGNVWEWVQDCYHENYQGAPADGSAWEEANGCAGGRRASRGGS